MTARAVLVGLALTTALGVQSAAGLTVALPGGARPPVEPGAGISPPRRVGDADTLTLPNLAPLPPFDVSVGAVDGGEGRTAARALRFSTVLQNRGRAGFELVASPWLPDPADPGVVTAQAYQCVRFTGEVILGAQRECVRYDAVGALTTHVGHRHTHLDQWGRSELRRDVDGRPDPSPKGLVSHTVKPEWCLSDLWNWRLDDPGVAPPEVDGYIGPYTRDWYYLRNWYQECTHPFLHAGASWRQGISPGWGDFFPPRYPGQGIPLRGVADGIYWIVTTINPKDNRAGLRVRETTWADNTSASRVQLYAGGTKARLLGPMPKHPYADWLHNPPDQPGQ